MSVRIVTDSTADLPPEKIRELGITVVPAYIMLAGKTYLDGVDISPDELYHRMVDLDQTATTSQPPPSDFAAIYRGLLKDAKNIISIQATSRLSGIYSSAMQASQEAGIKGRVAVFDSESVSMGLGLLVMGAARLAKAGEEFPRIMEEVKNSISRVHIFGVLDTLKYLYRSGRIGKARALFGSVLNIKPVLTMHSGEITPIAVARTRSKAIDKMIQLVTGFSPVSELAVVHSTTPEDSTMLRERLLGLVPDIHISRLGPALGVHGGPGMLITAVMESKTAAREKIKTYVSEKKLFDLRSPSIKIPRLRFELV